MRVVARVHAFPPAHCAGAEMMLAALLDALTEQGHDCRVLLSHPAGHESYRWNDTWVIPPHAPESDLWGELRAADVVITHLSNTTQVTASCRQLGKPVVQVLHNDFGHTTRREISGAQLLVANSQWLADSLGIADDPRTIVVRPPVKMQDYATTPGDHVTLVNCMPDKGGHVLSSLAYRMTDVRFLAVKGGYGTHVPQRVANVATLNHTPRMVDEVYSATKVLLMPSIYESWGRVGVEAMSSGIPVIAHPTPGLLESLGDAGTFVDRDDLDGWERAIRRLLDDPDHYAERSWAALARAAELDPTADLAAWVRAVESLASPIAADRIGAREFAAQITGSTA